MANLHFKYGVMGSSKSALLLTAAHNFRKNGVETEIIKPAYDTRFGTTKITYIRFAKTLRGFKMRC